MLCPRQRKTEAHYTTRGTVGDYVMMWRWTKKTLHLSSNFILTKGSINKCRCPTSSSKPQPYPITAWHRAPRRNDRLSQHPRSPVLCTLAFLTPLHTGTTATQTLLCHTRLIIAACATLYLSFILLSFLRQRVWGPIFLLLWVHVEKKKFLLLWSKWEQRECNFASLTLGVTSVKSAF